MKYIIFILFICIIILLKYMKFGDRASVLGYIVRKLLFYTNYLFADYINKLNRKYRKGNDENWKVKEKKFGKYIIKNITINKVKAGLIVHKKQKSKKIILQLHGGGYELGLPYNNLHFAKKYSKVLKDFSVLTINYRVAPKYKYPAALEDSVEAYKYILKQGYSNEDIIIVGDSAGGGLAIATVMYLRDNNIKLPKAIITMSAWTDLTNKEESFSKNYKIDPIFGVSNKTIVFTSRYAEGMDKKTPYISPIYGDFKDFPSMLMQVGTNEMLISDTLEIVKKAKNNNVDVTVGIYKGMFHIFQSFKGILFESDLAWKQVREFVKKLYD